MNISSKAQIQQFLDKGLYDHHFQPIINIQNLKVLGFESLIRSKHHFESPESLFNNAKKLNKLFELDVISITMAIQSFNNEFDSVPIDSYLFLNIYPSTLASPNFINILFSRVEKDSLLPNRLILEINESEHIENYSKLKENIFELQSLGLQIALDDFDKGTTPFKRIIELEPNYIKLDKYFATNLAQSINKQKMLKLLIKYCLSNNIKIILEGIETNDDLIVAKSLGVQFGQGFLFGKPNYINNFVAGRDKNG